MGLKVAQDPQAEPVTLTEAKLWLGVTHSLRDAEVTQIIKECRQAGEMFTGRSWINQSLELTCTGWPAADWRDEERRSIWLERPPASAVASVKYYDENDAQQTLDPTNYWTLLGEDPDQPRVVFKPTAVLPTLSSGRPEAVVVAYTAGYGAAGSAVPGPYLSGLRLMLGHLWRNRSEEELGTVAARLGMGVETLWGFRRILPV